MTWVIIVGILVGLVAAVWIIGMLIPLRHTASRTARFKQSPEAIFAAISEWRAFPTWRKELKEVRARQGTGGRESWIEVSKFGEMPLEVIECDPPRRMVGRIADPDHKLPFGGTWTYVIQPTPDGCTLKITEDGEIHSAPFRFMARFVFGYTATMQQYLKALGRKFGEEAIFEKS